MKDFWRIKERLNRAKRDRRIVVGWWARYRRRRVARYEVNAHGIKYKPPTNFKEHWELLRQGTLKFPRHIRYNEFELRDIGERRARNAKHPAKTGRPLSRVPDFKCWKVWTRKDTETGYLSYLRWECESMYGEHMIVVELDLDTFLLEHLPLQELQIYGETGEAEGIW